MVPYLTNTLINNIMEEEFRQFFCFEIKIKLKQKVRRHKFCKQKVHFGFS